MYPVNIQIITLFGLEFTFLYDNDETFISLLINNKSVSNEVLHTFENIVDTSELYDYIDKVLFDNKLNKYDLLFTENQIEEFVSEFKEFNK